MGSLMAGGGIGGGGNAGNYTTSNYSPGTTVNGKGYLLIFPTVAAGASGHVHDEMSSPYMYSSIRSILINIDGLGDASIGVNSQDRMGFYSDTWQYSAQDAEPMTFMFTKSIVASGDGIQKAILYLESN